MNLPDIPLTPYERASRFMRLLILPKLSTRQWEEWLLTSRGKPLRSDVLDLEREILRAMGDRSSPMDSRSVGENPEGRSEVEAGAPSLSVPESAAG